jgi:hypothetical protein
MHKLTKDLLSGKTPIYSQKEYQAILAEDFGSLNWIAPQFKLSLSKIMNNGKIGQQSTFSTVAFKNASQVLNYQKTDPSVVAILGKVGDDQLFISTVGEKWAVSNYNSTLIQKYTGKSGYAYKDLRAIIIALKDVPGFEVIAIKADPERAQLQADRAKAKSGAIAMMPEKELERMIRYQFRDKLAVFKTEKAKTSLGAYATPEDAKAAFASSIPQTINVNGMIFNLYNDYNTGIGSLLDKNRRADSYLSYRMAKPDEDKMRYNSFTELKRLKELGVPDDEAYTRTRYYTTIKVYIGLEGNTLVVTKIETER